MIDIYENKIDECSLTFEEYKKQYTESIQNPEKFWSDKAKSLDWITPFKQVVDDNFKEHAFIRWFDGGSLNVSYNCLDRHLKDKGDKVAIIWESDDPSVSQKITYNELHKKVCKLANGLKQLGVKKGDRITIYLPMIPEAAISMLACSRIGAIHSVVFGGFAPESLKNRIEDCESSFVITANEGLRGGKKIPLLSNVKKAIEGNNNIKKTIVVKRTDSSSYFDNQTDIWYEDLVINQDENVKFQSKILKILYSFCTHQDLLVNQRVFFIAQLVTFFIHHFLIK